MAARGTFFVLLSMMPYLVGENPERTGDDTYHWYTWWGVGKYLQTTGALEWGHCVVIFVIIFGPHFGILKFKKSEALRNFKSESETDVK
jgi:hypothetical protein